MFHNFKISKELLLLSFAILLVGLIFIYVIFLSFSNKSNTTPIASPTPIPTPTSYPLTNEEKSLPEATPQPFRNAEEKNTGTLVVTSEIDGVDVILDATDHRDSDDPIAQGQPWPHNKVPFTVEEIPVGKHYIFAAKPPEYDTNVIEFEIKKDEVTRVEIKLNKIRTSN